MRDGETEAAAGQTQSTSVTHEGAGDLQTQELRQHMEGFKQRSGRLLEGRCLESKVWNWVMETSRATRDVWTHRTASCWGALPDRLTPGGGGYLLAGRKPSQTVRAPSAHVASKRRLCRRPGDVPANTHCTAGLSRV